jgi:nitric oxide reductase NorD protein
MVRFRRREHSEAVPATAENEGRPHQRRSMPSGPDSGSRYGLLASAIAGREVGVSYGQAGEPTWTDCSVVFVDPGDSPTRRVTALAVQASLIAAGSLDEGVVAPLVGRPTLANRYLALEGWRALLLQRHLLPPAVLGILGRHRVLTTSPETSLAMARSRQPVEAPPPEFGRLQPRRVQSNLSRNPGEGDALAHQPRRGGTTQLNELLDEEEDEASSVDLISSPVGGGGGIGRLLKKMLGDARTAGGGPPGADSPTHWSGRGDAVGREVAVSTALAAIADGTTEPVEARTFTYPEWDVRSMRYRPDWCTVVETLASGEVSESLRTPDSRALRRSLVRLGMDRELHRRCMQGDDIDLDAAVEACVETAAGSAPDEAVYLGSVRSRPGLSVLVLLDVSGSAGEPGIGGVPVHEHQRTAALALTSALYELGHRVACYAFRSQGRTAVHVLEVMRFCDRLDGHVVRRLAGLVPGAYTRLGAAIRRGTDVLGTDHATSKRLMVVVSDGLAYDHGYERAYGEADARQALAEARRRGIAALCLSVGAGADAEALRRVFGTAAHAGVERPEQLPSVLGPLMQSALQAAEIRRSRYQRRRRAQERHSLERSIA